MLWGEKFSGSARILNFIILALPFSCITLILSSIYLSVSKLSLLIIINLTAGLLIYILFFIFNSYFIENIHILFVLSTSFVSILLMCKVKKEKKCAE